MAKFTNYSLEFDQVGTDYIDCGQDSSILRTGPFTFSMWLHKQDAWLAWQSIMGADSYNAGTAPAEDTGWLLWLFSGNTNLYFGKPNGAFNNAVNYPVTSLPSGWFYLTVTYDGTANGEMFVNGVSVNSAQICDPALPIAYDPSIRFFIGGRNDNAGGPPVATPVFGGGMSDIAMWDTVLDQPTIASLYNSGKPNDLSLAASYTTGGGTDSTSNLCAWWRMDEATFDGTDWTILDKSSNSNDGTSSSMGIEARVGNAPDSINNGVTVDMEEADRIAP